MTSLPTDSLSVGASAIRQQVWRTWTPLYFKAIAHVIPRILGPVPKFRVRRGRIIRVVGLLSTATGIGQSARLCVSELQRNGHHVITANMSRLFSVDDNIPFEQAPAPTAHGGLSIYHLNPPMMLIGQLAAGLRRYRRDVNVAYWAWELPALPSEWRTALDHVDAVMVPSTFCQATIAAVTDKPVIVVPHPVPVVAGRVASSPERASPFRVLSVFNCGSSLYRKNPWASIRAFKRAFGSDPDVELILKIADGNHHRADLSRLHSEIGCAQNIRIVDELMGAESLDALLRSADVYISLHRSEGFGLTVAEAIMREVPVVVTNWSGTADFCPPYLAHCVRYDLVPVNDPHPVYHQLKGALWAEPSVEAAANYLVAIRHDPASALARAERLRVLLIEHLARQTYSHAIETVFNRCAEPENQ